MTTYSTWAVLFNCSWQQLLLLLNTDIYFNLVWLPCLISAACSRYTNKNKWKIETSFFVVVFYFIFFFTDNISNYHLHLEWKKISFIHEPCCLLSTGYLRPWGNCSINRRSIGSKSAWLFLWLCLNEFWLSIKWVGFFL